MPSIHAGSAASIVDAIRRGEYSAVERTETAIRDIEKRDVVNAVVVRDFERALEDARAIDHRRARGRSALPLMGVPMTVKESFDLAGRATTWGFPEHADHRAAQNAVSVQRLKDAGAIILGKTNVPTGLGDWQCDNELFGRTVNPHDVSRTAGGSSGGAAAALALGLSALELGSDMGGSLRVPAAFCGVYSHKPTWGLIPQEGMAPGGQRGDGPPLAVVGPMATTPDDLAIALSVLAGPDALSPFIGTDLEPARETRLGSFRVLALDAHPSAAAGSAVRAAVLQVAQLVSEAGGQVSTSTSSMPDLELMLDEFREMLGALAPPNEQRPVSAHDWFEMCWRQRETRLALAKVFMDVDVIVTPAFGVGAFPHDDEPRHDRRTLTIDGRLEPFEPQLAWAAMANYGNLPSTTVPVGTDRDGLPIAVQVIAPHRGDLTGIAFARALADHGLPGTGDASMIRSDPREKN